jgi:hypothetical protein
VRQPANPVVGAVSLALTDSTPLPLMIPADHRHAPRPPARDQRRAPGLGGHDAPLHTQWIHDANGTRVRHAWGKGKRLAVDSHKFEFFRADQIATGDQTEDFTLVGSGRYPNLTYRILDAETIRRSNGPPPRTPPGWSDVYSEGTEPALAGSWVVGQLRRPQR